MKFTRLVSIYLVVSLVLVMAFGYAGAWRFRFFTALSTATWVATGPGLQHK